MVLRQHPIPVRVCVMGEQRCLVGGQRDMALPPQMGYLCEWRVDTWPLGKVGS
jgi:hypothetical protein